MYYIYYGYVDSDTHDASEEPVYKIKECDSEEEVLSFRSEFDKELHDECDNIIFRVFEGKERTLVPKKIVESYELE